LCSISLMNMTNSFNQYPIGLNEGNTFYTWTNYAAVPFEVLTWTPPADIFNKPYSQDCVMNSFFTVCAPQDNANALGTLCTPSIGVLQDIFKLRLTF